MLFISSPLFVWLFFIFYANPSIRMQIIFFNWYQSGFTQFLKLLFSKSFKWDPEFFGYMDLSREGHSTMRPSIFKPEVIKILVNIFRKTLLKSGTSKTISFLKIIVINLWEKLNIMNSKEYVILLRNVLIIEEKGKCYAGYLGWFRWIRSIWWWRRFR